MYKISPFTPLFFSPSTDKFNVRSRYIQKFASSDQILIEIIATNGTIPDNLVISDANNIVLDSISWHKWEMNDIETLYFHTITGLDDGYYSICIGDLRSEPFQITKDESIILETTLVQYSMKDNRSRTDCVFWIDGMQYFFDFRVPGGFKDDNWAFGVDNEQFITSDEDIIELYSHEYTQKTFTLGNYIGCPIWFAELFNRALCCNYVYFDGIRYARKDSNVPELNQEIEGVRSYVFTQILQQVKMIDPYLEKNNQMAMRRVNNDFYRGIINNEVYKPLIIR